jgi:hypothetical protein
VRSDQTPLILIDLHEADSLNADVGEAIVKSGAVIERDLARLREADDRIDIDRAVWNNQMVDTHRLIYAFGRAGGKPDVEAMARC